MIFWTKNKELFPGHFIINFVCLEDQGTLKMYF